MPVVITSVLPSYVTVDMVRAVEAEIGDAAPDGLIAHAAIYDERQNSVRIVSMWESQQAHDHFAQTHLAPAVRKVAAANGIASPAPVSSETAETIVLISGGRVRSQ